MTKKLVSLVLCLLLLAGLSTVYAATAEENPYEPTFEATYTTTDGNAVRKTMASDEYVVWQEVYDLLGIALPNLGWAVEWYPAVQRKELYPTGTTPRAGSIVCYTNGFDAHLAYVLGVADGNDGKVIQVIEGGVWNGTFKTSLVARTLPGKVGSEWWRFRDAQTAVYTLQGYIYLDGTPDDSVTAPTDGGTPSPVPTDGGEDDEPFDCKGFSGCPQFTIFFDDAVPYSHYAHAAIDWAIINSITNGLDESHFGPEASCTRGQVVTFLWRAAGSPEPAATANPFTDVTESDYFCKPVLWAIEKGITAGTSATTFSPGDTCSSAHIVTFLYRALGAGKDGWYEQAKAWANGAGLLAGTGLAVNPTETCPRMAVVTFLYRSVGK